VSAAAGAIAVAADATRIEARALSHRYGPRVGLGPVGFAWQGPGVVAVTGANGAGKSTLLRILAGLLKPSHGELHLTRGGRALDPAERRHAIGFASPELAFYPELSALENLSFAAGAAGAHHPAARARAALERVQLAARGHDRVAALSSGLVQRLRLAFALLHAPALVLLDEPGSHLDDEGRALLGGLVADAAGTALVVIATNDEREWRLARERVELRGRGVGPAS
jgi:heme exporter protein A